MKMRRDVASAVVVALLAACGGANGPSTATTPPSGLTYSLNPAVYTVGTPITQNTPTSSGSPVVSYSVSPALPPGTSLNTTTGVIGGTPTVLTARANYTVTATNSAGSTTAILSITVNAGVAPPGSVSIAAICSPPAPDTTTGGCLYPATCTTVLAGTPVLDVTTAQLDFRLPVQIDNLLTSNASPADGRVNTNDAFVQSLEITYSGGNYVAPWNPLVAVTVPTAGSAAALFSLVRVQDFPALMPSSPAGTAHIVVNVRAHGILASQNTFTTPWFQVPVDVCNGCLAGGITCMPPAFPAYCPSSSGFGPPGQTANAACVTP